ncbi:MAG: metal-sensing transcriptional repressor [bacterium]|nr:metal-sensing transcriptional repressor [bacterium]
MAQKSMTDKERALHRLKITRGHLNKVIDMVEKDAYCIDVIHQSQAVQKALKEVDHVVLEKHLNSCVIDHIKQGKSKETIEEIMKVVRQNK